MSQLFNEVVFESLQHGETSGLVVCPSDNEISLEPITGFSVAVRVDKRRACHSIFTQAR